MWGNQSGGQHHPGAGSGNGGNGNVMMRLPNNQSDLNHQQQQQQQQQQHHMQQQQQQQQQQAWFPDPAILQELRARGPGQYRVQVRSFDSNFGGNGMSQHQQQQGMPMGLMNRPGFQQQQQQGSNGSPNGGPSQYMNQGQQQQQLMHQHAMTPAMHPHMPPQMQQIQQWQAAQMAAAQQQAQQNYLAQNGMYSVDVVRNQSMGADVFLIQAGNFPGFPMQAKKSKKRRQRDPLAPKPARYAWNFFFKEHYKKIRNKNYGGEHFDVQKAFTDIGHSLGDKWKSLTAEEKEPYNKMAQEDKKRFEREMKEYTSSRSGDRSSEDDDDDASNADADSNAPENAADAGKTNGRASERADNSADDTVDLETKDDIDLDANPRPSKKSRIAIEPAAAAGPAALADDEAGAPQSFETEDGLKVNIIRPGEAAPAPNMTEMTADVLVTDDDETFIVMMSATLRKLHVKEGYQNLNIHVAHNGEEALRKIVDEKQRFAVVTMDKVMGELDGVETVKKMREAGYDGCVVGVTGDASSANNDFEEVGADRTLYKNQSGLFSQVHSILVEKLSGKDDEDAPAADSVKPSSATVEEIKDEATATSTSNKGDASSIANANTVDEAAPSRDEDKSVPTSSVTASAKAVSAAS